MANAVGQEIAKAGAILISGGKGGVMEAACRGAKSANGLTIGILPELSPQGANPYLDIVITTGIGYARNYIKVASSDAVISICGAGGTLSEIGYAIALQKFLVLMKGTGGVTDLIAKELTLFEEADIHLAKTGAEALSLISSQKIISNPKLIAKGD